MRSLWLATPVLAIVALLAAACGGAEPINTEGASSVAAVISEAATVEPERRSQRSLTGPGLVHQSAAPEFTGLEGWINSEALTVESLLADNRVILVDFWTYTCINCIRTLPFLRDWHEKYADRGLTIVGVHAPEFEFEENRANVIDAVERRGLSYPIAQDNEMLTWRAFNNAFWPAKYLVGADGSVRYQHFGEGSYDETETAIRSALEDAGYDLDGIVAGGVDAQRLDPHARAITRELYGGYQRSYDINGVYAAQEEYYAAPDATVEYEDVPDGATRNHQQWYLQGLWRNEREAIVHARDTVDPEDYIAFRFVARSVNVVLRSANDEDYTVVVELDGAPLAVDEAGTDIVFDEQGRSVILVDEPRMYAVVELPVLGDRELRLRSTSSNFSLFAVTFGAYTSGS